MASVRCTTCIVNDGPGDHVQKHWSLLLPTPVRKVIGCLNFDPRENNGHGLSGWVFRVMYISSVNL